MITPYSMPRRSGAVSASVKLVCLAAALAAAASLAGCKKSPASDSSTTVVTTTAATTVQQTQAQTTGTAETTAATTGTIPAGTPPVGWCSATTMHIRSGAGTDYGSIGGLKYGDKVTIVGREGDWYKITFKDGFGYVNAQFVSATELTAINTTAAVTTTTAKQD